MATTVVLDRPVPNRPARTGGLRDARDVARLRVTAWRVIASEWVKFRSLRSTVVTIAIALVVIIGFGALAAGVVSGDVTRPTGPGGGGGGGGGAFATNPTAVSLAGMTLAQIIVGILGVLAITGEYSSGMIRATLAAVPRRLPVLWAKVLVIGVSTFIIAVPASFGAFALGQTILGTGRNTTLSDPGVLRAVLGSAVYLTAIALLGLGLGALLRHTAGAIGALFGLLLVAPGLLPLVLPKSWGDSIVPYLPSNAGESFSSVVPRAGMLSAGGGALVLVAWLVVLLGVSAWLLRTRDA